MTLSKYLNVQEVANMLGVTPATIYKLINHPEVSKRIEPVNRLTYRGDGGYRFSADSVELVKEQVIKKDLTIADTAKLLNRSKSFVHGLIREGKLKSYEDTYRGKKTFFIKKEDLEQYNKDVKEKPKSLWETIYDKKTGVFLFQPYFNNGELARVMSIGKNGSARAKITLKTSSSELTLEEALGLGWKPTYLIEEKKQVTAYGFAKFVFPIPRSLDSVIYQVIDELFKAAGPYNMRVKTGEMLEVEIKKTTLVGITESTEPDLINKLKTFAHSGEIVLVHNGTVIDPGYSSILMYLPYQTKKELLSEAENEGMKLHDYLADFFNNKFGLN